MQQAFPRHVRIAELPLGFEQPDRAVMNHRRAIDVGCLEMKAIGDRYRGNAEMSVVGVDDHPTGDEQGLAGCRRLSCDVLP